MSGTVARSGKVYLAVTTDKKLYIIKQVGARSWDAFNMDGMSDNEHIHSNRKDIIDVVQNTFNIDYIAEFNNHDKIRFRKSVMEFMAYGTIGVQVFNIEKEEV
jgi:hypothetical protein